MNEEQAEYCKEQLSWQHVSFDELQHTCGNLIDKPVQGVLSLLDEESVIPKGSEADLLQKLCSQLV